MKVETTALEGVLLLTPRQFADDRGMFMETYNHRVMEELGLPTAWPQDNFSVSKRNVVRGLHYQVTQPQGKLIRVQHGAALDIAVDLRRSSPTFGRSIAIELTSGNGAMLWIPVGFAHGFLALSETLAFAYKVTDYYSAAGERTILWNDPDLAVEWPVSPADAILSVKDAAGTRFREAEVFA